MNAARNWMMPYVGTDLDRFQTTYNSEYSCQKSNGSGDGVLCKLSMELIMKKNQTKDPLAKTIVKEGKRRGEKVENWKVTKGARERNREGVFGFQGRKRQSEKLAASRENKSTQTQNLDNEGWTAEDIWKRTKKRPGLENLSKVKICVLIRIIMI